MTTELMEGSRMEWGTRNNLVKGQDDGAITARSSKNGNFGVRL